MAPSTDYSFVYAVHTPSVSQSVSIADPLLHRWYVPCCAAAVSTPRSRRIYREIQLALTLSQQRSLSRRWTEDFLAIAGPTFGASNLVLRIGVIPSPTLSGTITVTHRTTDPRNGPNPFPPTSLGNATRNPISKPTLLTKPVGNHRVPWCSTLRKHLMMVCSDNAYLNHDRV